MMQKIAVFMLTICMLFAPAIAQSPNETGLRSDRTIVVTDTNTSRAATTRGASVTNRSSGTKNRASTSRNDSTRSVTSRSESSNSRTSSATRGAASRATRTNNVVNRTSAASNTTTRTDASTARTATATRVSRAATTTAPQTARTRAATNTVQNATRARTATTTNMAHRASPTSNAAKTGTRRARTTSSLNANATITDTCREQYTQCMDNFCNVLDDNQGRCSCSKNIKNYAKTEEALKLATESLQDVAQQIQYIGLTNDEIETLFSQTEAEIAMQSSTDNSQIKNDLDKIRGLIVDVKTGTASSTETGLSFDLSGLLDFSIDSTGFDLGSLFGNNQTNTSSISNQRGEQLYKTAAARCKKSVLDSCAKAGANTTLIANTYDMEIDRACVAYERSLTDQNDEMVRTVRNANTVLQKARLMVAQQKNTYDLRGCLNALDSCMQDDFVCGTDYELCLDPTGKYIVDGAIVTGSTPGFVMTDAITDPMPAEYSRGTLMGSWTYNNDAKFAWAAENEDGTLAEYIANTVSTTPVTSTSTNLSEFLQHKIGYIDNRNKPQGMCGTVLTKCQAITMDKDGKYNPSNRLITEYLTRTLTQIKLAQDKILSEHASACIADVESCLNTNNYSGTNTSAANIAINACRAQIKTCMSVNGNTSANPTPEIMKNWIALMMTDEAQNLCLLTGGTWDSNSNDCSCPSGYLPDDNGTCKTTTAINPFNPSNNPTTQTTMVLKKSVKHDDGSASAIVRDTDTGILFTTVVQADGTTNDSVDGACVISSTSTTVNQNTCDDENTVTLFNGAGGATFAVRRALTDPEETVSFTFNGDPVSYLNLALENGKLPSDVSWVLNLSTDNYVFAGITDESGTQQYYDKNAKRIMQTPPANSELHITFDYHSNAELACHSNKYGKWDDNSDICNCTSDTYRLDESTGVCEPIDSRELNCTNSGGVWTDGACNCADKFGTIVKSNKCVCDTAKNAQGTASKTSDCSCKSGYKKTDDGKACEWDYTESINACTNSGGTWNDTDHICDCSGKFGAKADGYKCVCDTSKNVAENDNLTKDTECECNEWYKPDTDNSMCVTDDEAIGCRDTAGTWDPDSRTCDCAKNNMSTDPTNNQKCQCDIGWTLNSDNTACIVDNAYTKCTDSGGVWTNGTCDCSKKFGTIKSDGVCICDPAKNTTGNPTSDNDCACADGYYKETETSTQCTFDTAAQNCTGSGGEWNGKDRTCACNGDHQEQGDSENTCKCSDGYQLNDNNTACIATTDNTNCTNSGGTWTNGTCECPTDKPIWDSVNNTCQSGQSGGTINKQQVCKDYNGKWTGTTCECPDGKKWLNNQCVTVTVNNCGENATLIDGVCVCNDGWSGDGTTCTANDNDSAKYPCELTGGVWDEWSGYTLDDGRQAYHCYCDENNGLEDNGKEFIETTTGIELRTYSCRCKAWLNNWDSNAGKCACIGDDYIEIAGNCEYKQVIEGSYKPLCENYGFTWSNETGCPCNDKGLKNDPEDPLMCVCADYSHWDSTQQKCVCNDGYKMVGSTCVPSCSEGFMSFKGDCIPAERPEECTKLYNSRWDDTDGCLCNGFDGMIPQPDSPSTCACDTDNGYTGIAPNCEKHNCTLENTTWDSAQQKCVCMENYTDNNGVCEYTPCITSGGEWNSSTQKCVCTKNNINIDVSTNTCYCNTNYTIQDVNGILHCVHNNCTAADGTWNSVNTTCNCPDGLIWGRDTNNEYNCITSPKSTCENTGGTWANNACTCDINKHLIDGVTANTCECDTYYNWNSDGKYCAHTFCTDTDGAWNPETNTCNCPSGTQWNTNYGCYENLTAISNCTRNNGTWDVPNQTCDCSTNTAKPYWNNEDLLCEECPRGQVMTTDGCKTFDAACTFTGGEWTKRTGEAENSCYCTNLAAQAEYPNSVIVDTYRCMCAEDLGFTGTPPNCTPVSDEARCTGTGGTYGIYTDAPTDDNGNPVYGCICDSSK